MHSVIPVGGGAAVRAKTGTGSKTNAGSFSVTGIGFQPDMVVLIGSYFGTYVGVKSIDVGDIPAFATNLSCYASGSSTAYKLNVTSLDADGFTASLSGLTGTMPYTWYAYKFS